MFLHDFAEYTDYTHKSSRLHTHFDGLHTQKYLSIDVARPLKSEAVLERRGDLFVCRGVPKGQKPFFASLPGLPGNQSGIRGQVAYCKN